MLENYSMHEQAMVDSCAFDPKYEPENSAALEIFELNEKGLLILSIAHSIEKEIEHPNTPSWVKKKALTLICTYEVDLVEEERQKLARIEEVLAGSGGVGNIKSDAKHIYEAHKYCDAFITTDDRILKKRPLLKGICSIEIFKPSEYLTYFKNKLKSHLELQEKMKQLRIERENRKP